MSSTGKAMLTAEQARTVRGYLQGLYNVGLVACLIGVLAMAAGSSTRFPAWLASAGVVVMVLGLGLLIFAMVRRIAFARSLAAGNGG